MDRFFFFENIELLIQKQGLIMASFPKNGKIFVTYFVFIQLKPLHLSRKANANHKLFHLIPFNKFYFKRKFS